MKLKFSGFKFGILTLTHLITVLIAFGTMPFFTDVYSKESFAFFYLVNSALSFFNPILTLNTQFLYFRKNILEFDYEGANAIVIIMSLMFACFLYFYFYFAAYEIKFYHFFLYFLLGISSGIATLELSKLLRKQNILTYCMLVLLAPLVSVILRILHIGNNSPNVLVNIFVFSTSLIVLIVAFRTGIRFNFRGIPKLITENRELLVLRSFQTWINQFSVSGFLLLLGVLYDIDVVAKLGLSGTIMSVPNLVIGKSASDFYLAQYSTNKIELREWYIDIRNMFGVTLLTYILIVSIPESIYIFFFNDLGEGIKPYLLAYFFFFLALTANKPIIAILNVRGLDKLLFKWEIYSTLVKFFGVFAAYFLGSSELVIISIFASLSFLAYFILFFVVRKDFVR